MAPIKEFSSADLNTISRLSGVSNVLVKVNGATVAASSFSGLLDTYTGAAAAYSVRKLDKDYTGSCMRIVVDSAATVGTLDSSDPEFDIGFDTNGDLDTAEIVTRCNNPSGTNYNAYVTKWYDQSGNGNDAAQTTYASMPQIYNGSAVITENGKPSLDFDGSDDSLKSVSAYPTGTNESHFTVRNGQSANGRVIDTRGTGFAGTVTGWHEKTWSNDYITLDDGSGSSMFLNNATYKPGQLLRSTFLSQSSIDVFDDGASYGSGTGSIGSFDSGNILVIGGRSPSPGVQYLNGTIQEVILYPSDQSSNRSDIETDINDYFQIGNFPNPTSGLLSTYTGAAAAYSVRQLANTAALSMRVRRDNDDAEQDFGFDANGDLDTAAIATFVGSGNNGYVSKFYDQSGNGNDATQSIGLNQPQIYDGSAVITDNGKPALDTLTTGKLNVSQLDVVSAFYVARTTTLNYASYFLADATTGFTMPGSNATHGNIVMFDGVSPVRGTNYVNNTNQLLIAAIATSSATIHVNGVSEATGSMSSVSVDALFNGRTTANINFEGKAQEIVLYTSDQSSNRSGIETDINNYFSIY